MSNKLFNALRTLCEVGLPALGSLYLALSKIWGLPYGAEICGSISAVGLCLGSFIGVKRKEYNNTTYETVTLPEGGIDDGDEE